MGEEVLMSRHRHALCVSMRWLVAVILALGTSVTAHAVHLFVPVPEPRATAIRPEQNQVIEHLQQDGRRP